MEFNGKSLCELCFSELDSNGVCHECDGEHERHPIALPKGAMLQGRYVIGQVLGKGGFGVTYLAYDLVNETRIAIKEYMPDGIAYRNAGGDTGVSTFDESKNETFVTGAKKFYDEAQTISRFNGNPNIISVYEFFHENGTVYYTMEFLDGIDLKKYLRQNKGRLSEQDAMIIASAISDALLVVHSTGILHRDISPDNIFICTDGRIKLLDFGAARQVVGEQSKSLSVILKQGFAPAEQYQTKGMQGPWTDIYAFGATLYYITTGLAVPDVMTRFSDPELEFPPDVALSEAFKGILVRCLQLQPENRYQSIMELKRDFSYAYQASQHQTVAPPAPAPQSPQPSAEANSKGYKIIAAVVGGCAAVFLILVLVMFNTNTDIQYKLGNSYYEKEDFSSAFNWYEKAANGGYAPAQYIIAEMYYNGNGVNKNLKSAFEWFDKAYENGYTDSAFYLGVCYTYGYGTDIDKDKAIEYYEDYVKNTSAVKLYDIYAEIALGFIKEDNYSDAVEWLDMAADEGGTGDVLAEAYYKLALECNLKYGIEDDRTIEAFDAAVKLEYAGDMSELGEYFYDIGYDYYFGQNGKEENNDKAFKFARKAAICNNADGQYLLGECYLNGYGTSKNYDKAFSWLEKSAKQDNIYAQNSVGYCYEYGYGVEKDYKEAFKWYKKSADQGYALAQCNLGICYQTGRGTEKDYDEAFYWYKEAADQGYARAQCNLGVCYYDGIGVSSDRSEAKKWFKKAAEQGYELAQKILDEYY